MLGRHSVGGGLGEGPRSPQLPASTWPPRGLTHPHVAPAVHYDRTKSSALAGHTQMRVSDEQITEGNIPNIDTRQVYCPPLRPSFSRCAGLYATATPPHPAAVTPRYEASTTTEASVSPEGLVGHKSTPDAPPSYPTFLSPYLLGSPRCRPHKKHPPTPRRAPPYPRPRKNAPSSCSVPVATAVWEGR